MCDFRYLKLLEDLCKNEKVGPPVYTTIDNLDTSSLVQVRVDAGFYSRIAEAENEPMARETAAHRVYKKLLKVASIHFLAGVTSEFGNAPDVVKFHIRKQDDKPWRRRQAQQILNSIKLAENQRGLIDNFKEYKRIKAMKALNKEGTAEYRIKRAAAALGLELIWEEMLCKPTEPPLVVVKLPHTKPGLTFFGLDRADAAYNCATYLKTILLEDKKDSE